jgi:CheY-like chemotaxis protein
MTFTAPPTSGPTTRAPRILLVDDDPLILRAMQRLLRRDRSGWKVECAESGAGALALLRGRSFDVVVTDLHMPKVGGVEVLRRLKTEHPEVIRVIHSSHVEPLGRELLEELTHAVITKPCRPDELLQVLDWALDEHRRRLRDSVGS